MNRAEDRAAVRRVLMYWGNAERARASKAEHIAELEQEINALYDLHPQELSDMPHGSNVTDPTSDAALRAAKRKAGLTATIARLRDEIAELDRRASAIEREVMCLPPLECEVIRLRYTRYGVAKAKYWSRIALRVHISEDYARRLERTGADRLIGKLSVEE